MFRKFLLISLAVVAITCLFVGIQAEAANPLVVPRGGTGISAVTEGQSLWGDSINHLIATSTMSMNMSTGAVTIGEIVINAVAGGDLTVQGKITAAGLITGDDITSVDDITVGDDLYLKTDGEITTNALVIDLLLTTKTQAVGQAPGPIKLNPGTTNLGTGHVVLNEGGGKVGVGTTSPATVLDVYSTASTTSTFDSSHSSRGACQKYKDLDGGGYTYCVYLNGAQTCSAVSCQ